MFNANSPALLPTAIFWCSAASMYDHPLDEKKPVKLDWMNKPLARGVRSSATVFSAPADCPPMVTFVGSPQSKMEVPDLMKQHFITAVQNALMARIASGETNTESKYRKLPDDYVEELSVKTT